MVISGSRIEETYKSSHNQIVQLTLFCRQRIKNHRLFCGNNGMVIGYLAIIYDTLSQWQGLAK
ncbi:hypothetical protein D3C71_1761360 [compost metagenome]